MSFSPMCFAAVVVAGSAAEQAGLLEGDQILAIDAKLITDWGKLVEYIAARPDSDLLVKINRQGIEQTISLHTERVTVRVR